MSSHWGYTEVIQRLETYDAMRNYLAMHQGAGLQPSLHEISVENWLAIVTIMDLDKSFRGQGHSADKAMNDLFFNWSLWTVMVEI